MARKMEATRRADINARKGIIRFNKNRIRYSVFNFKKRHLIKIMFTN